MLTLLSRLRDAAEFVVWTLLITCITMCSIHTLSAQVDTKNLSHLDTFSSIKLENTSYYSTIYAFDYKRVAFKGDTLSDWIVELSYRDIAIEAKVDGGVMYMRPIKGITTQQLLENVQNFSRKRGFIKYITVQGDTISFLSYLNHDTLCYQLLEWVFYKPTK